MRFSPSSKLSFFAANFFLLAACGGLTNDDKVDDQFTGYSGGLPAAGQSGSGGKAGAGGAGQGGSAGKAGGQSGGGQGGVGGFVGCGDGTCSDDETCTNCPNDCGVCPSCTHDPCVSGGPLQDGCSPCTQTVCGQDPFCCQQQWDQVCVAKAKNLCGLNCGQAGAAGAAGFCGDNSCGFGEDSCVCPQDCGPPGCGQCGIGCGDGTCNCGETNGSCPSDCPPVGGCGDGICSFPPENAFNCPQDCPPVCNNQSCEPGEDSCSCPNDCGPPVCGQCGIGCGDGQCNCGENANTCGIDCKPACNNGACEPGETPKSCPGDCKGCGDGKCVGNESCSTCPNDCGACCGNQQCDNGESCSSCPNDCGSCACSHKPCDIGPPLSPECSPCVSKICTGDGFCCGNEWDQTCVDHVLDVCGSAECGGTGGIGGTGGAGGAGGGGQGGSSGQGGSGGAGQGGKSGAGQGGASGAGQGGSSGAGQGGKAGASGAGAGGKSGAGGAGAGGKSGAGGAGAGGKSGAGGAGAGGKSGAGGAGAGGKSGASGAGQGGGGSGGCGNGVCGSGETCETCPKDCGACPPCTHSPCQIGTPLKNNCEPCVAGICNQDPFCCTKTWDINCTQQADSCACAQGGAAGASGSGGASGKGIAGVGGQSGAAGSVNPQVCLQCLFGSCSQQVFQCLGDAVCQQCLNNFTPSCVTNPTWQQAFLCACGSCAADCPQACGGGQGGTGASGSGPASLCGDNLCDSATESCKDCEVDCGPCGCSHGVCTPGAPLTANCSPCAAQVCQIAPECCNNSWSDTCVAITAKVCGDPCNQPGGELCGNGACQPPAETCGNCQLDCGSCDCSHDPCTPGAPLQPQCSPCAAQVCAQDPFCCDATWDGTCATIAKQACGPEACMGTPPPPADPHDVCPGQPTTTVAPGQPAVIAGDTTLLQNNFAPSCDPNGAGADAVYRVLFTQAGLVTFRALSSSALDPVLSLRLACTQNDALCTNSQNGPGSGEVLQHKVQANQVVFVVLDGASATKGTFQLQISY